MDRLNDSKLNLWKAFYGLVIALALSPLQALAAGTTGGPGVSFHGRLTDSLDQPVLGSSVTFKIQIRSTGTENCLLYSESQTVNLSASDGIFAITLNDGSGTRNDSTGINFGDLFSNNKIFTGLTCDSGTTWNPPSVTEARNVKVSFQSGTDPWETFAASPINYVPQAIEAQKVAGYSKDQLLRVAEGVPTSSTEFNGSAWTGLLALLAGTSSHYLKTTGSVTFGGAPSWGTAPISSNELTNKAYVDAVVATATLLPTIGTPGTYFKVTTDTKGRVSSGVASLVEADIPTLTSVGKVSIAAVTGGTPGISVGNVSGNGAAGIRIGTASSTATGLLLSGVSGSGKGIYLPAVDGGTGISISTSIGGTGLSIEGATSSSPAASINNTGGGPALVIPTGKVGIGTNVPSEPLEVAGTVKMASLKLTPRNNEPSTCSGGGGAAAGLIALTSNFKLCACNGTSWIFIDTNSACSW